MTAWVGPLGSLLPVEFTTGLERSAERPSSTRTTLGGRRKAQIGPRLHREIKVGHDLVNPEGIANLAAIVAGEFGPGPFCWVDEWAQVTNLLTPQASMLETGTWATSSSAQVAVGGSVLLPGGGRAGRSLVVNGSTDAVYFPYRDGVIDRIPVIPGRPVTASVYALGAVVNVRLTFVDAAGTGIYSASAVTNPGLAGPTLMRCSAFGVAPADAVSCYAAVTGATRIARPAVTWTPEVTPWHVGRGIPRAIVTALDESARLAGAASGRQWASADYAITEVG
jgi:hypothetical protein